MMRANIVRLVFVKHVVIYTVFPTTALTGPASSSLIGSKSVIDSSYILVSRVFYTLPQHQSPFLYRPHVRTVLGYQS
jgi:hypothetical protein